MPKSLKEALLEQLDALQERGLAPAQVPEVEEEPETRFNGSGTADFDMSTPRRRNSRNRQRVDGQRRPERDARARRPQAAAPFEEGDDGEQSRGRSRRARVAPRERRPDQPAEFVAPAPQQPSAPPVSRTDILRERSDQRKRDQNERQEISDLLSGYRGAAPSDDDIQQFFAVLTEEVGALPPLRVVVQALRLAESDQPSAVGSQVRAYYRSARARHN